MAAALHLREVSARLEKTVNANPPIGFGRSIGSHTKEDTTGLIGLQIWA
jgi:hypothetical protein